MKEECRVGVWAPCWLICALSLSQDGIKQNAQCLPWHFFLKKWNTRSKGDCNTIGCEEAIVWKCPGRTTEFPWTQDFPLPRPLFWWQFICYASRSFSSLCSVSCSPSLKCAWNYICIWHSTIWQPHVPYSQGHFHLTTLWSLWSIWSSRDNPSGKESGHDKT